MVMTLGERACHRLQRLRAYLLICLHVYMFTTEQQPHLSPLFKYVDHYCYYCYCCEVGKKDSVEEFHGCLLWLQFYHSALCE